jgi:hypothetical protein
MITTASLRRVLLAALLLIGAPCVAHAQIAGQPAFGGTSGGSANAQTITIPNISSLGNIKGVPLYFTAGFDNTAAMTLTVSGLAPTAVKYASPSGPADLLGGEVKAGNVVGVMYDGTQFNMLSVPFTVYKPALRANLTVWVRTDGNCSNDGSANDTSHAFATIQCAWDKISQLYDPAGFTVTIRLGVAGTYAGASLTSNGFNGNVTLIGDTAAIGSYVISSVAVPTQYASLYVGPGVQFTLQGVTLNPSNTTTGSVSALYVAGGGFAVVDQVVATYTPVNTACSLFRIATLSQAYFSTSLGINGGGTVGTVFSTNGGSTLNVGFSGAMTITNTSVTVGTAYTRSTTNSIQSWDSSNITFSGSGSTGTRYSVDTNAIISTGGGGATFFPGTADGAPSTGGQYL